MISARITVWDTSSGDEEETINGAGEFTSELIEDNSSLKSAIEQVADQATSNSLGLGQKWTPVFAHSDTNIDISNPGTDTFGGCNCG